MAKGALAYVQGNSFIHRLNPITVLTYTLSITVLGIGVGQIWILMLVFAFNMVLVYKAGVIKSFMGMFLRVTIPIVVPMFIIDTLFYPGSKTILYQLGPLMIRYEGLMFAATVISRLLAILSAYFMMVLVIHPRDLMIALGNRGVSPKIGYLVLSTLQLIPYIQQTAERILDAQRSRGLSLKGSIFKRFKSYIPLMAPVVMGSFASLEIRAMALEVRGFNLPNRRVYIREVADTPQDAVLRRVIMVIAGLILVVSIYFHYFAKAG